MRRILFLVLLLFALPLASADHDRWETRRYQSLWPLEETAYLFESLLDGHLVCTPTGAEVGNTVQERSLGGVCFDVHEGDSAIALWAHSTLLVNTPPTFVLRYLDEDGDILRTTTTCQLSGHSYALPAGTSRVMALAIDGSAPGCASGPAAWGTVVARIH